MYKVLLDLELNDKQIQSFKDVSNEYEYTFDKSDTSIDIAIGNLNPKECKNYPNLKLIISTWVGYDAFIKKDVLNPDTVLVNAVDVHTEEVAEHMFALLISLMKNIHLYRDNQKAHTWKDEGKVKSYKEMKVAILGFGNIGKYLAKLCKGLDMYVIAVKRNLNGQYFNIDELKSIDELDEILPRVDAVLSVLPSSKETYHLFTKEKFNLMKKDAVLINAGRGDLIDTDLLKEILDQKLIAGIGQDVFEKEPIDSESKLWDINNLIVTPHVAGFFHLDLARQKFVDLAVNNLKRYINNETLNYVVAEREK